MAWFEQLRAWSLAATGQVNTLSPVALSITEQIDPTILATGALTQEDQYWGHLNSGSEEDYLWRRLTDNVYMKDVQPSIYLELHNLIYEAYHANPLAFTIIEITTSFVLGKGVSVDAVDHDVQRILLEFWHDPDNTMDERIYNICNELALYGEIFVRFFVNQYNGTVKVRLIDPSLIDLIETDPEDFGSSVATRLAQVCPALLDIASLHLKNGRVEKRLDGALSRQWFVVRDRSQCRQVREVM